MPLPIRTAALLGTPSKTLLSGTPEFVRGSRQFCVTLSVLALTRMLIIYFLPDLFRDGEAIPASIDEGEKCRTGIRKHWKYRTRTLGYDALMEMILVPRCTRFAEGDCLRGQLRKLLQELVAKLPSHLKRDELVDRAPYQGLINPASCWFHSRYSVLGTLWQVDNVLRQDRRLYRTFELFLRTLPSCALSHRVPSDLLIYRASYIDCSHRRASPLRHVLVSNAYHLEDVKISSWRILSNFYWKSCAWPVQLYKPDFGTTPDRSLPSFDSIGQLWELKFSISCWNSKDSQTLRHGKGSPWRHTRRRTYRAYNYCVHWNSPSCQFEFTSKIIR